MAKGTISFPNVELVSVNCCQALSVFEWVDIVFVGVRGRVCVCV